MTAVTGRLDSTGIAVVLDVTEPAEQMVDLLADALLHRPHEVLRGLASLGRSRRRLAELTARADAGPGVDETVLGRASEEAERLRDEVLDVIRGGRGGRLPPVEALLSADEALDLACELGRHGHTAGQLTGHAHAWTGGGPR